MRLLLVGDDILWRKGLIHLLGGNSLPTFYECASRTNCLSTFSREKPDIVLIRCASDCMCCMEVAEHLLRKYHDARILIVAEAIDIVMAEKLLSMGILGIVNRVKSRKQLAAAIRKVSKGISFINDELAIQLTHAGRKRDASPFAGLSLREYEVFTLIIAGKHIQDISKALSISGKTVSNHLSNIRNKLNVATNVGLLKLAIHHGISAP